MKMWISKYALIGGIKEEGGRASDGYFYPNGGWASHSIGTYAHETREEAVAAAEAMRIKKIASLRKQISKLEKLEFSGEKE